MASSPISDIYAGRLRELVDLLRRSLASDTSDYVKFEETDTNKRSLINLLTILGESQLVEQLFKKNENIFEQNLYGYSIVHLAAIWDNATLIKALYFSGADLKGHTSLGEDAIILAKRYHSENVIKVKELRESFVALIEQARHRLKSAEKMGIKLTKEERRSADAACTDKENWLSFRIDRSLEELKAKKEHLELILEPIFAKFEDEGLN